MTEENRDAQSQENEQECPVADAEPETESPEAGAETRWDAEWREETGEELAPPRGKRRLRHCPPACAVWA